MEETLTHTQKAVLETIRANGGYACQRWGMRPRWVCASFGEHAYEYHEPVLPSRTMDRRVEMGVLRFAPGRGYGSCSFWEIAAG
jgi:hypothetical protein